MKTFNKKEQFEISDEDKETLSEWLNKKTFLKGLTGIKRLIRIHSKDIFQIC